MWFPLISERGRMVMVWADMVAVCFSISVDRVWGVQDWAILQHTRVLVRTRVGIGQIGLGFRPLLGH